MTAPTSTDESFVTETATPANPSVCVIGAGASGLAAAFALNEAGYAVTVIEKNPDAGVGGHSSSTEFVLPNGKHHSGNPAFGMFFVSRYPNFNHILQRLNIETEAIGTLKSIYSVFSLDGKHQGIDDEKIFHTMDIVDEVARFLQEAREIIQNPEYDYVTAQRYLEEHNYSERFIHYYFLGFIIVFFGGHPLHYYLQYPIRLLIAGKYSAFLDRSLREETVYRIKHGTGHYIKTWQQYLAKHGVRFYFSTTPEVVSRNQHILSIRLHQADQSPQLLECNRLIISTLPDDALTILANTATEEEIKLLSAFPITHDTAILHTDEHFMPGDKTLWRYGNAILPDEQESLSPERTYGFTSYTLCNLDRITPIFCTYAYNKTLPIQQGHKITNRHVHVTPHTLQLREQLTALQGRQSTWFVGSWTKNLTLHEDAIVSGLEAANAIVGHDAYVMAPEPHLALLAATTTEWDFDATFIDVLTTQIDRYRDKNAFILLDDNGQEVDKITYQELYTYATKVAVSLTTKWHARPGDCVLLCYKQGIDFIAAFLGCLLAGIVPAPLPPIDPSQMKVELNKFSTLVADCGAKIILTDGYYYKYYLMGRLLSISLYFKLIHAHWRLTDALRYNSNEPFTPTPKAATDLAYLQYTSGSTATPKGVMVSHQNLLAQLGMLKTTFQFDDTVIGCYWIPQFHSFSLVSCILLPIYVGATTIILSPLTFLKDPKIFADCLSRYHVTLTAMPNFGLHYLLKKTTYRQREQWDWRSLAKIMLGAEPINAALLDKFIQAFAVTGLKDDVMRPAYGMTEHVLGITLGGSRYYHIDREALQLQRRICPGEYPLVGCGQPPPNVTVKIVTMDRQPIVEDDEIGEIWVDSPSKALGYWKKEHSTQDTFHATLLDGSSGQTYLRTGDLGFFHKGELFVCGRLKEIIIVRGHNLFPTDIEYAIEQALPENYANCCVAIGVAIDAELGEELIIIIESAVKPGAVYEEMVKQARRAVVNICGVAPHSVLVVKTGSIPRTRTRKLRRTPCKQAYLQEQLTILYADTAQTEIVSLPTKPEQPITEAIALALKNLTRQTLDLHKPIHQQVRIDSLQAAELVNTLSTQLSVDIPLSALVNHQTVQALADYIATLPKSAALPSNLVLLNAATNSKQIPLFLMHPARGNVQIFLELARAWDYPIYGLQQLSTYSSLEEMAAAYIDIIKTAQANGPYFVGGYSFGASLSLEIANQLLAHDKKVIAALLIDELHAATAELSISGNFTWVELFLQVAKDYVSEQTYSQLTHGAKLLPDEESSLPLLTNYLQNNQLAQQILREVHIYRSNLQLLAKYNETTPKLPIIPIGLFKSATSFNKNVLYYNKVVEVPGTHLTLLTPPYVQQLALEIKKWVDATHSKA